MIRRLGLLFLLAIAAAGGFAAWLDPGINKPYRGYKGSEIFVDIPKGTSRWEVSGVLKKDRVIRSRLAFELLSRYHSRYPLQAGEYRFDHDASAREIFWQIARGKVYVYTFTVPEGWTMYDIADALEKVGVGTRGDFLRVAQDPSLISDLAPQAKSLEGFLFPSSYEFTRHTTPKQAAALMIHQFRVTWERLASSSATPPPITLTPAQTVTLASLVERETPLPAERPVVASVFYNRLELGHALQCDPTVQYALLLEGKPTPHVSHADLSVNSAYNTYLHTGLPPGPIANPGEASLQAVLQPAHTDYLYFVANDRRGHFFSRTLAEHNRNVARYRHLLEMGEGSLDPIREGQVKKHGGGS